MKTWKGWETRGRTPEFHRAAQEWGRELAAKGERVAGPAHFAGLEVYAKGGPLGSSARRRHGFARRLVLRDPPRLAEYENLRWLRRRLFRTVEPVAAAVLWRHGFPRYQLLVTLALPGARTLGAHFEGGGDARQELVGELARETARMHSLHFIHRDLFPRNVLIDMAEAPRRIVFLDTWAGGPGPGRRGAEYDLACLLLEGASFLAPDEQRVLVDTYLAERERQARPVDRRRFLARVERERATLSAHHRRHPERLRGRAAPPGNSASGSASGSTFS